MSAKQLYERLLSQRVELWCQGKMLRFRAPGGTLDPVTMADLRRYKNELIELIQQQVEAVEEAPSRLEPTTIGQQALFFLHLSAPYSPAYNVASACRIASEFPIESLQNAFGYLIQRHDALRSTLEMRNGQLWRRVHATGTLDFQSIDASDVDEEAFERLTRQHYQLPFDLAKGPLVRVRWFQRGPADGVLLLVLHHLVFDAWSLWIVQDELFQLLGQELGHGVAALPSPKATFTDFVNEQSRLLDSPAGLEHLAYWKQELGGDLPVLDLPLDRPRPPRGAMRGATERFRIPADITTQIRELSQSLGITPFALTLSIFKVLLHRISGQDDLIVGTTTSGRIRSHFTPVVGYFVNSLAIRSDLASDPTFAEFAGQVKTKVLRAIKHQAYPFAALVDQIRPNTSSRLRSLGSTPVFSVMFGLQKPRFSEAATLHNETEDHVELAGLSVGCFELDQQEGQFDLTMELFESQDSFQGSLKYDTEIFDESTARRLCEQYIELTRSILDDPHSRVSQLDLMSAQQKREILAMSSGGTAVTWDGRLLHQWIADHASSQPEKEAIVCRDQVWSYQRLDRTTNQIARYLIDVGVRPGDLVGCVLSRSLESTATMISVLKSGAVIVPLDPESPSHRNREILARCGASVVVHDGSENQWSSEPQQHLSSVSLTSLIESAGQFRDDAISDRVDGDAIAYVLHTSGSTGKPKGVAVSHRALAKHIVTMSHEYEMQPNDRVLQFSNYTFDPAIEQMGTAWQSGATLVMRGNELWSPQHLWESVSKHRLSVVNFPPIYFEHCESGVHEESDLTSLRLMILGGDVFPTKSIESWRNRRVRILNAYGPTEALITATVHDVDLSDKQVASMPIGRPRPGCQAYVLDTCGRPCGVGVPGQLFLAGPLLANGYWKDAELTDRSFVVDPFAAEIGGGMMYDTGDRARWNRKGELEFLGRLDDQVKIGGVRTDTKEIEAIINELPSVAYSVVAYHAEGPQGEVIAWVESREPLHNGQVERLETQLLNHLKTRLPRYMIPRHLIVMDALPVNASGKVDRRALPVPSSKASSQRSSLYTPPRNEWESKVADIMSDELNVSPVGVHDNFFDLGGASLSSLRIMARVSDLSFYAGVGSLRPELLFEYPTIAQLHQYVASCASSHEPQPVDTHS